MFSLAMITQNTVFLNNRLDNIQQNFVGTILNMTSLALLDLMFFKFSIPPFFALLLFHISPLHYISALFLFCVTSTCFQSPSTLHTHFLLTPQLASPWVQ